MAGQPASYDLNAVADALAAVFDGVLTGEELNGVPVRVTAHSDVPGQVEVPAVILELDDIQYDQTMGAGMDEFTFIMLLLVEYQDQRTAQRSLRSFMSRDGGMGKLKAALEADQTLGDLVSVAHMTSVRRIGVIEYGEAAYLGAEIPIEVTS